MAPYALHDKWGKGKFEFQKVLMNISKKNETKAMHNITFKASNGVNGLSVSSVAITRVMFQYGRKLTFNPTSFGNEFGDPQFFLQLNISFSLSSKYADFKTKTI